MSLIDTHAHLCDAAFDDDRGEVLRRARDAGLSRVIEIADAPELWDRAIALCRARPRQLSCSLGLHPYYADRWEPGLGEDLARKARLPEVVAAGEIGLDYAKCSIPPETQRAVLVRMLEAARAARLPVVLHCRRGYADLMDILRDFYGGRRPEGRYHGVVHCFSGNAEEAVAAVELGFAIGADGPVTYPKNDGLRRAMRAAGLDAIVLETDSPYLPPQSLRGKRNEPRCVVEIAEKLAEVFGGTPEEISDATNRNAIALFGPGPSEEPS
ncbi:TatD family hydrolase [Elusimicrobiota bacterium]